MAYNPSYGPPGYNQSTFVPTTVAQPYNGPTAQEVSVVHGVGVPANHVVIVSEREDVQQKPPSHCLSAWFSCIFCCWPIGLIAIYNSFQVDQLFSRRDYQGAVRASERARAASNVAVIFGIIIIIITSISGVELNSSGSDSADPDSNSKNQ